MLQNLLKLWAVLIVCTDHLLHPNHMDAEPMPSRPFAVKTKARPMDTYFRSDRSNFIVTEGCIIEES